MKTYGTIKIDRQLKQFLIKTAPQVTIRLKRVFGKLSEGSFGTHRLNLSEENARDLDWFILRYPLDIDDRDRQTLDEMVSSHRDREEFIQQIYKSDVKLPFDLAVPAREYQKQAAVMWHKMEGLLLGDDVGLGKTVSCIAGWTDPRLLPHVVVTLTHLPYQWQSEIKRFAPHLSTHIVKKGTPYTLDEVPDVTIINYHKLPGWAETLAGFANGITFDEIQELRRSGTQKMEAAQGLIQSVSYRLGLSATPIYNYGGEIYNIFSVLRPGDLGTREEFFREWCSWGGGDKARIVDPKAFGEYLRDQGLMLRRTRKEVKREIPPISKFYQTIDADMEALNRVSDRVAELARLILREEKGERGEKFKASEEMNTILRQATGIAKAPYTAEFVKLLLESGEKVVLYGWHHQVYQIWMDLLKDYNPVLYTGKESVQKKEAAKQAFINGDSNLLIISLRAGAGLDGLQYVARTVVFGELDWSPGVMEQCIGRIARDGQEEPVMAYFLISEVGCDPVMIQVNGIKREQIEGIRDPNAPLFEKIQTDSDHMKKLAMDYLRQQGNIPVRTQADLMMELV